MVKIVFCSTRSQISIKFQRSVFTPKRVCRLSGGWSSYRDRLLNITMGSPQHIHATKRRSRGWHCSTLHHPSRVLAPGPAQSQSRSRFLALGSLSEWQETLTSVLARFESIHNTYEPNVNQQSAVPCINLNIKTRGGGIEQRSPHGHDG